METFHKPKFSQAPAWLPAWLLSSPVHSGLLAYDTPSMFKTSCKDFGDSSMGKEHTDTSNFHVLENFNKASSMLVLSRDDDDMPQDEDGLAPFSINPQSKALVLQLSLSTEACSAAATSQFGASPRCEECGENMAEGTVASQCIAPQDFSMQIAKCNTPETGYVAALHEEACQPEKFAGDAKENLESRHDNIGDKFGDEANVLCMSQQTASTELYVPPVTKQLNPCNDVEYCANSHSLSTEQFHRKLVSTASHPQFSPCHVSLTSNGPKDNGGLSTLQRHSEVEENLSSKRFEEVYFPCGSRSVKKARFCKSESTIEDVEAAIVRTVTAAEALAIANVVENWISCQEFGSNVLLDAALRLKRGRQMCGLDDFTLDLGAHMELPDDDWIVGLDDRSMEEAFVDVGLHGFMIGTNFKPDTAIETINEKISKSDFRPDDCAVADSGAFKSQRELHQKSNLTEKGTNPDDADSGHDNESSRINSAIQQSKCVQGGGLSNREHQELIPKVAFSSRWFGGWTGIGMGKNLEKQNQVQLAGIKKKSNFVEFETSNLSESENFATQDTLSKQAAVPVKQKEAVPVFSSVVQKVDEKENDCRQILKAVFHADAFVSMSQASVACSTSSGHEPLCSFVPCSISEPKALNPIVANPSAREVDKTFISSLNAGFANQGIHKNSAKPWNVVEPASKLDNGMLYGCCEGKSRNYEELTVVDCDNVLQASLQKGVKRRHVSSLKPYSTDESPFGFLLQAVELAGGKQQDKQHLERCNDKVTGGCEGVSNVMVRADQQVTDTNTSIVLEETNLKSAADVLMVKRTDDQHKEIKELLPCSCTDWEDTPLLWHRGKKRRLRACRIVDSGLIQDFNSDSATVAFCDRCSIPVSSESALKVSNSLNDGHNGEKLPAVSRLLKEATKGKTKGEKSQKLASVGTFDVNNKRKCLPSLRQKKVCEKNMKQNKCAEIQIKIDTIKAHDASALSTIRRGTVARESHSYQLQSLFKGFTFLITGLPASTRDKLARKIEEHEGVVLSNVPPPAGLHSKETRQEGSMKKMLPIIIAPQQMRTSKYLYGRAVGCLIVRPDWIYDCISSKRFLSSAKYEHEINESAAQQSLQSTEEQGRKTLFFSGMGIMFHGQPVFCSKLASLIKHGGGQASRIVNNNIKRKFKGTSFEVMVVEHPSRLPRSLKYSAGNLKIPIVPGDWVVDSLIAGKFLPLPAIAANLRQHSSNNVVTALKQDNSKAECAVAKARKKVQSKHRKHGTGQRESLRNLEPVNASLSRGNFCSDEFSVTIVGEGSHSPPPSLLDSAAQFLNACSHPPTLNKFSGKHLYYQAICFNGLTFSAGEIVEIQPYTQEETEPYVAQIESFFGSHVNARKRKMAEEGCKKEARTKLFMRCRWFYRPSDTCFPCVGCNKELYLSEHYDHDVPIQKLLKKVVVALIVEGRLLTHSDKDSYKELSTGDVMVSREVELADYVCRFFYNHEDESLHQLKSVSRQCKNSSSCGIS